MIFVSKVTVTKSVIFYSIPNLSFLISIVASSLHCVKFFSKKDRNAFFGKGKLHTLYQCHISPR